eukprot:10415667-Alexandrium_andersonii.AAC.1
MCTQACERAPAGRSAPRLPWPSRPATLAPRTCAPGTSACAVSLPVAARFCRCRRCHRARQATH